jgi:arginyl-tRNA synthetase
LARVAEQPYPLGAPEEQALALKLLQFSETVELLAADCLPNQLCLYLYDLSGVFMKFYEACPVLKAEGAEREARLGLCHLTARTLKQGLNLLGITTLEQM